MIAAGEEIASVSKQPIQKPETAICGCRNDILQLAEVRRDRGAGGKMDLDEHFLIDLRSDPSYERSSGTDFANGFLMRTH